jgi:hypothetical protein
MGYKIEILPNEPIILETWDADYNPSIDASKAAQEIIQIMDAANGPMSVIVDMRAKTFNFNDILLMAKLSSGSSAPSHHPKQRKRVIVTDSRLISTAAKGLDSDIFGHIKLDIADNLEDALKLVRQ